MSRTGYTYTKEDCKRALRKAEEILGESPSRPDFRELDIDGPAYSTIRRNLGDGSWTDAKENAGLSTRQYREVNEEYFEKVDKETAYWIGFFLGDGSVTGNQVSITLAERDIAHIEKWKETIESEHKICSYENGDSGAVGLSFRSDKIVNDLNKIGIVQNKTHGGSVPELNDSLKPPFYRGWIDADGHIRDGLSTITLTAANKNRLEEAANDLPVQCGIKYSSRASSATLTVNIEHTHELLCWLYPDGKDTSPALERKQKTVFGSDCSLYQRSDDIQK